MKPAIRLTLFLSILCFFPVFVHAAIVINEVQIAGSTATDEFIELYNTGSDSTNLSGWRLTKRTVSGNEYNLLASFPQLTIQPGSFFVIGHENFSGTKQATYSTSQSMASDNTIVLYQDAGETIVDVVGFGTATMNEGAACPNPQESKSAQRIPNGADTNHNASDFLTATPTPGAQNGVGDPLSSGQPATTHTNPDSNPSSSIANAQPASGQNVMADIVISEILPNPAGSDTDGEWIELKNNTMVEVDLSGWILEDSSGHGFLVSKSLANTDVAANGYYSLEYAQTKISLNNVTDVVILKRPNGVVADRVSYSDLTEGQSYVRIDKTWKVTDTPTKNASNVFMQKQKQESGIKNQESGNKKQSSFSSDQSPANAMTTSTSNGESANPGSTIEVPIVGLKGKIRLSEIMPNPEGDDEELEWIEIENVSDELLELDGLKLKDKTSENVLPTKTVAAGAFVVFQKPEFSLTLNNSEESLELIDATGAVIDIVSYADSEEGISYSRVGTGWKWASASRGVKNKSDIVVELSTETKDAGSDKSSSAKKETSGNMTATGVVLVRPNVFGKTIIYISGEEGNHQIYFQKGDWPELRDGDVVEIRGQTSTAGDVPRIKIQSPSQIVSQSEASILEPDERTIEELSEDDIGRLFRVSGEMLESSGSALTIGDETGELEVYFKSSEVKKPTFQQGKSVRVTGILVTSSKGIRLLPRYPDDVEFSSSKVLGASDDLPEKNNRTPWKTVGGVVFIVGIVGYSFRQKILERYEKWKVSKQPIDDSFEE